MARAAWIACIASLSLTACLDGVGPRPRPGGSVPVPTTPSAALLWYETQPRVISQGQTDTVRISVAVDGTPDRVTVELRTGALISLAQSSGTVYSGKIPVQPMLFGYRAGDLHIAAGFIEVSAGGKSDETPLIINVKDATVPVLNPQTLAPGVQAGEHVVNIRYDSLYLGGRAPSSVLRTFYTYYPDDFTFAAVVEQVHSQHNRFFSGVRNHISGIGLNIFDEGQTFGSDSALEGMVQYPIDSFFDLAETANIHEIAHRWMNYLRLPALAIGTPHWPLSDLALGVIGWSDPVTHEPLGFTFVLNPQPNGTWVLQFNDTPRTFNDLELYLMGLIPADSVQPHIVFRDQNQKAQVRSNGVLRGQVDTVTIANVVASEGPRVPAAGAAPRQFRIATIVLSRGGVLTRDELSFFDHMAARGEQKIALQYTSGLSSGITLPFYIATSGLAPLVTRLRSPILK